jgi:hypothetical protein
VRRLVSRLWKPTRELWERARKEHSTPREIGWSVAVGVFCGCTPFLGLHMWIALAAATVLRLNRLWAFLGSRVCISVVIVWIAFAEIELAHRLRTGGWLAIPANDMLASGRQLLGDWLLGTPLVGVPLAALLGLLAYRGALRRRASGVTRTPGPPRPPSSGSPPSAPPAPTP